MHVKKSERQRALLHRLNGQLLQALDRQMACALGDAWRLEDWIINILLLNRSVGRIYTARMESSSTFHRGELFQNANRCDPEKVGGLDFEAPLDLSFSGYCIQSGEIVWVENLSEIFEPGHPLRDFYRKFEHVAVRPDDSDGPTGEYVFPILAEVGLVHIILGVLNMEFFGEGAPLGKLGQLRASGMISRLLQAHGPFLMLAGLPEISSIISDTLVRGDEPGEDDPESSELHLLKLHRKILEVCLEQLQRELQS